MMMKILQPSLATVTACLCFATLAQAWTAKIQTPVSRAPLRAATLEAEAPAMGPSETVEKDGDTGVQDVIPDEALRPRAPQPASSLRTDPVRAEKSQRALLQTRLSLLEALRFVPNEAPRPIAKQPATSLARDVVREESNQRALLQTRLSLLEALRFVPDEAPRPVPKQAVTTRPRTTLRDESNQRALLQAQLAMMEALRFVPDEAPRPIPKQTLQEQSTSSPNESTQRALLQAQFVYSVVSPEVARSPRVTGSSRVAAKYASISQLEDRAYTILKDLCMI